MSHSAPIGIFDSGIGGLTVFRAIQRLLPNESLLYVGDTARVPYGNKTAETVTQYSLQIAEWLLGQGVKAIVVACNTASAVALSALQSTFKIPVIGMIAPGAAAAIAATKNKRIGVIGTRRTVESAAYDAVLRAHDKEVQVVSQACPLFVPLVEEGMVGGPIAQAIADSYLTSLVRADVDAVILGCTHYPLLQSVIQTVMGPKVSLIDSGVAAATAVSAVLHGQNILAPESARSGHCCYVTDAASPFAEVARRFLDDPLPPIHVLSHSERLG